MTDALSKSMGWIVFVWLLSAFFGVPVLIALPGAIFTVCVWVGLWLAIRWNEEA